MDYCRLYLLLYTTSLSVINQSRVEWNVTTVLSNFGYLVPALKRSSVSFTEEKTNERFYYCFLQAALFQIHGLFVCLDDFWYNLRHFVHHFGTSSAEAKTPKTEEDGRI